MTVLGLLKDQDGFVADRYLKDCQTPFKYYIKISVSC